jgi:hypothetical protein
MKAELVQLYHLARTALSARPAEGQGKMDRINWAAAAYHNEHPSVTVVQAKIALYEALA